MRIAVTGASGFIGRALVRRLESSGHSTKCLHRPESDIEALQKMDSVQLFPGNLAQIAAGEVPLDWLTECDAIVHSAFWRPGDGFRNSEGDIVEFARVNILGTLQLIESARSAGIERFIFVSTCGVHDQILDDRPLDEAHPLWPMTHYGAHKAAIEKFVHSYGLGHGYGISAIRPTGVYGVAHPIKKSKWYSLIEAVVEGSDVPVRGGGKEIHVDDVARGIEVLLNAPLDSITGQSFACYDQYVSQHTVAGMAAEIAGVPCTIIGEPTTPKHRIDTQKIRALGMAFGGEDLLRKTIEQLVGHIRS